jgi:hypothetical protein
MLSVSAVALIRQFVNKEKEEERERERPENGVAADIISLV